MSVWGVHGFTVLLTLCRRRRKVVPGNEIPRAKAKLPTRRPNVAKFMFCAHDNSGTCSIPQRIPGVARR